MLEKARRKKLEWRTMALCRSLVLDMMGEAGILYEEKHCRDMVTEIVEMSWREVETRRLVSVPGDIQNEVEKRITEVRREEQLRARRDKKKLARNKQ